MTAIGVDSARLRIDRLRADNPAAADLATLLSTAVRIEPSLIRDVRLMVQNADVGAELDLWTSEILGSASPLAISLAPDCAELLRTDLAGAAYAGLRDRVDELIKRSHADLHWSLRLEEKINRLMIGDDPTAVRDAEQLLFAAVRQLRDQAEDPDADPTPVARWLLAALGRIPSVVASSEAGVVAELSAGAQLDQRFDPPSGASATTEAWMPWLLAAARVETRTVPVRFPQGNLVINEQGPGAVVVEAPGTEPMTFDVSWNDGTRAHHRRVLVHEGESVTLRVPVDEVELEILTGDRYRLVRPTHGRTSGALVRGLDFSSVRARLRPCLDRVQLLDEIVTVVERGAPVVLLSGPPGAGKSVLLGAALDRLEHGGYVVAQHFYGIQRTWDARRTLVPSLLAKVQAALPDAGLPEHVGEPPDSIGVDVLRLVAAAAGAAGRRGVVVALDALPDDLVGDEFLDIPVGNLSEPTPQVAVIATTRHRFARPGATSFGATVFDVADDSMYDVCQEMLLGKNSELELAFGSRPGGAWSEQSLVEAAGGIPGRLAGIVNWLLDQPVGTARIVDIPPTLTGGMDGVLRELESLGPHPMSVVAGAQPGFTVGDLTAVLLGVDASMFEPGRRPDPARLVEQLEALVRLRLIRLDGPAAEPETVITLRDPGLRTADPFPFDGGVRFGHDVHAASFPYDDPSSATAYQITWAAHHHAACGQPGWAARLARCGGWLDLRQRTAGVDALVADLSALAELGGLPADEDPTRIVAQVVATLAPAIRAEPQHVVDLVYNGLCQVGAVRQADATFAPPPALRVRAVHDLDPTEPAWQQQAGLTAAAGWSSTETATVDRAGALRLFAGDRVTWQGPGPFLPRPGPMVRWDDVLVLSALSDVVLVTPGSSKPPATVEMEGVVTALAIRGPTLYVGLQDGTITALTRRPGEGYDRHRLVGHGGSVTALAAVADDPSQRIFDLVRSATVVISAEDHTGGRTEIGSGFFVAPGWVLSCAHVVATARHPQVRWQGHDLEPTRIELEPRAAGEDGRFAFPDAAVLRVPGLEHPCVPISTRPPMPGTRVVAYGITITRTGQPEISASRLDVADVKPGWFRLAGGWLGPRMSGGPVLDLSTFGVCGITRTLLGELSDLGGWAIPIADALAVVEDPIEEENRRQALRTVPPLASPGGLISISTDGTARVWASGEPTLLRVYRRHRSPVVALAVTAAGDVLSGDDKGRLRWWDPGTGEDRGVLVGHRQRVVAVQPLPDGAALTIGADGALWRWDLTASAPDHRPLVAAGPALEHLAIDDTARLAATWSADGVLSWWDLVDETLLRVIRPDRITVPIHSLTFDTERTLVLAHGGGLLAYTAPERARRPGGDAHLSALAIAQGAEQVAVGTRVGARVVDRDTGSLIRGETSRSAAVDVAFDGAGRLTTVYEDGSADYEGTPQYGDAPARLVVAESSSEGPMNAWLYRADGSTTPSGSPTPGDRQADLGPDATAVAACGPDIWFAAGTATGNVRVVRLADVPEIATTRMGDGVVRALAFADQRGSLVAGNADGTVRWANPVDGRAQVVGGHAGPVTGVATVRSRSGPPLDRPVSCSTDGTVRFWDAETGVQVGMVAGRVGFHAIAAWDHTVVARDAEGRLWVLEAAPPTGEQADRARVAAMVEEMSTRMRLEPVAPGLVDVTIESFIATSAELELRAVRLITRSGLWPISGRSLRLQVDRTGNVIDVVDAAGRLAVPRRITVTRDVRLIVRNRLRTEESGPTEPPTATLRLTFFSLIGHREENVDLEVTVDEAAQEYA